MLNRNLNYKSIAAVLCLCTLVLVGAYSAGIVIKAVSKAKSIDEKIAKSSIVVINKTNLDKAMQILKTQEEPVPEEFWLDLESDASSSAVSSTP